MKDKDLLAILLKSGWRIDRINGSHHILVKGSDTLSVPVHGKDMAKGLEAAIKKKAGIR